MSRAAEFRAQCPTCRRFVKVRRQGKTWRMVAHKQWERSFRHSHEKACPVRSVDAGPLIRAWATEQANGAASANDAAEAALAKAREAVDASVVRMRAVAELVAAVAAEVQS